MNYDQWAAFYRRKTGEKPNPQSTDQCVHNEHGFFYWSQDETRLLIKAVCGDGAYWESFSDTLCIGLGLREKWMISSRRKLAWLKKGWLLVREIPEGNVYRKVVL
ncbi:MAG: hypothetical protein P4N59_03370 [Negativicutes bacterium]|nr:hypothetical protein [Negativicutes bacterium]